MINSRTLDTPLHSSHDNNYASEGHEYDAILPMTRDTASGNIVSKTELFTPSITLKPVDDQSSLATNEMKYHHYYQLDPSQFTEQQEVEVTVEVGGSDKQDTATNACSRSPQIKKHDYYLLEPIEEESEVVQDRREKDGPNQELNGVIVGQEKSEASSDQSSAVGSNQVQKHHHYYLLEPSQFNEQERGETQDRGASDQHDKDENVEKRQEGVEGITTPCGQQNSPGNGQAKKHHYYLLEPSQFVEEENVSTTQQGTDKQDGTREEQEVETGDIEDNGSQDTEEDGPQDTDHKQP